MKLISSGVNAASLPYSKDTMMDSSMNRALTRSAMPTFRDIALMFILFLFLQGLDPSFQFDILLNKFMHPVVDVRQLVIRVTGMIENAS